MLVPVGLFGLVAGLVVAFWAWLGAPVAMPPSPLGAGEKLYCVSYAPFRGQQSPLSESTRIDPAQIDDDLARLARLTDCVRTYSTEHGLGVIPELAKKHGLKVLQGIWLGSNPEKNRIRVEEVVGLAKQFPDVIRGVIVGNEVLLRGELAAKDLAAIIRSVKGQVSMPVTYADVWEFWLRSREVYDAVDFVTIHILPYWEDFPVGAEQSAAHVEAIRKQVATFYPDREILIGETGWPSAGRMREAALPSPANQARVIHEVLAVAKREGYHVNVIEAFDQPWKRRLEGTVGGHWGFLDADSRTFKFGWGEALSNHPQWRLQAAGGVVLAALVFGAAFLAGGGRAPGCWFGVAAMGLAGGALIGWAVANVPLESLGIGGWIRSLAMVALAVIAPPLCAAALMRQTPVASFAGVLAPGARPGGLSLALGLVLIALTVVALQAALGLAFDPRYKDFPFAPLTAATVPFLVLGFAGAREKGARGAAEIAAAFALVLCVVYVVPNESFSNWQSLWFCAVLAALALILWRQRGVPG